MRVLICRTSTEFSPRVSLALRDMGHAIDFVDTIAAGLEYLAIDQFDLIVINLAGEQGEDRDIVALRCAAGSETAILAIIDQSSQRGVDSLLAAGINDFLVWPADIGSLNARLHVMFKQQRTFPSVTEQLGQLRFDIVSHNAWLGEQKLELTSREAGVLEVLIRNKGRVVSKEQIAGSIFSFDDDADVSSIRIYVHRVRHKLSGSGLTIRSQRGLGYELALAD